jgi:hypothetical protein
MRGMKGLRVLVPMLIASVLFGCEGPQGPAGPQGERGPLTQIAGLQPGSL